VDSRSGNGGDGGRGLNGYSCSVEMLLSKLSSIEELSADKMDSKFKSEWKELLQV